MIRLWIDDVPVYVPDGASVLDAARELGIDIPALCHHPDYPPNNSCMCCLVRVEGINGPVPSCATRAHEGMRVESETPSIRDFRRTSLELLLGDHAGDCRAPCHNTCPAKMDIPNMLRHVAEGDYQAAIAVVKQDIALPAILGRVCPEVCEHACRRRQYDSPAAICQLKQFVADRDLASSTPYRPEVAVPTGCQVAIVGGGTTGLTAAYHLTRLGHGCTIFEAQDKLGGRLRSDFSPKQLPTTVLDAEISAILELGIKARTNRAIFDRAALNSLLDRFDVVLLATGRSDAEWSEDLGLVASAGGVHVDHATRLTSCERVFGAGNMVRHNKLVVQSVAEGKLVAECIDCQLMGLPLPDRRKSYESRMSRLSTAEIVEFGALAPQTTRVDCPSPSGRVSHETIPCEAARCLNCDCQALNRCLLHRYARAYACDSRRYAGPGQRYRGRIVGSGVSLEIGKCIACGICVQIAAATPGAIGLAVIGHSTAIRVAPPPGVTLDAALGNAAGQCAAACPTGALSVNL